MTERKEKLLAWPILLWVMLFVGVPLLLVLGLSFLSRDQLGNIVFTFTFENYRKIFTPTYRQVFKNSFKLAFLTASISLLIAYPVAYFTSQLSEKAKQIALILIMIPFWTSSLMRTYGWMILLNKDGLVNRVLMALHLSDKPFSMMYRFSTVLIGTIYMLIPFMIISIFNAVDKLDKALLEASYDLGASRLQTFKNIVLPLTLPGIVGGFTLVFIPALGLYFVSDLLGGGQSVFLGNLINNQISKARNRPQAAALAVMMMLLVIAMLVLYYQSQKRIKGVGSDEA